MYLPIFPTWFYAIPLVIGVALIVGYVVLVRHTTNEKCKSCGATNSIEANRCAQCGESLMLPRPEAKQALGAVGSLLGVAPLLLLAIGAKNYPEAPIPELVISGIGIILFIVGMVVVASMKNNRIRIKQKATIIHTSFFGGFCAKCGMEMLGNWEKCPKCGWKVSAEKPNWATAAKNGKTGLPQVDLKVICPKCKTENSSASAKCKKCKANLLTYESVGQRIVYLIGSLIVSFVAGWLALQIYENPDLQEGFSTLGFGMVTLLLIAVVMPIWGLYRALSHGSLTEMLTDRASRHSKDQPWQALEDLGHALELAPIQEHSQIMTKRMSLYQALGLMQNATREELAITYATERNPQGGMGLFIAGNVFGDSFSKGYLSGISKQARKAREKMYAEGRAIVVGYCPICKEAVELNNEFKCPNAENANAPKHSGKPKFLQYVIPADVEAGKAAVLRAMEAGNKALRSRIVSIGLVIILAVGLCSLFNYLVSN
jgi:ribosomal protein L40E/uncharacterized membrane protein YeaQ/YmgE (transglycosylase-associated protein family)